MINPREQAKAWANQLRADPIAAAQIKEHLAVEEIIELLELPVTTNDTVEDIVCGYKADITQPK